MREAAPALRLAIGANRGSGHCRRSRATKARTARLPRKRAPPAWRALRSKPPMRLSRERRVTLLVADELRAAVDHPPQFWTCNL